MLRPNLRERYVEPLLHYDTQRNGFHVDKSECFILAGGSLDGKKSLAQSVLGARKSNLP